MSAENTNKVLWTEDQQKAIYTRNCNLLVAAAAGSGKTAVLVERIIKMITDTNNPIDIDKLLVVTFTNAAASEMRERIGEAISKEIHNNPESTELQKQLTLLNKSSITTIHSFCLEVIKSNFHQINLDPGFRIADETETVLLKQEAVEEVFDAMYEKIISSAEIEFADNPQDVQDFLKLVECYSSNKDDSAIVDMVLKLHSFAMSSPFPKEWLIEKAEEFNVGEEYNFGESSWANVLLGDIRIELVGIEKVMARALNVINETEGLEPYLPTFSDELAMIQDVMKAADISFNALNESLQIVSFGKLKACKNCKDKVKQKQVQDTRTKVKKQLNDLKEQIENALSDRTARDIKNLYPLMKMLIDLVLMFDEKYKKKKNERSIIDFNDFEHFCLEILLLKDEEGKIVNNEKGEMLPSKVAEELRNKYEEILIDEYQDSNMVQEVMLNMISKKSLGQPNVFMVGDVKQSIYRFRQAKPELFLQKYNSYSTEEGSKERKITLYKNFRSRNEVIEGVNYIFQLIMSKNIGELNYDEKEALNLGADFKALEGDGVTGGPIELHFIEKDIPKELIANENNNNEGEKNPSSEASVSIFRGEVENYSKDEDDNLEDESTDEEEAPTNIQIEARFVAKRIKDLMANKGSETFKVFDKYTKGYRPVEYKDIVILLRATSNWAPIFMEELKLLDIPVYADTGTGYFNTIEIQIMMALLQIVDNPIQDIPMLCILHSPMGGFTPEELIDIRVQDKDVSIYQALKKLVQSQVDNNFIENNKPIEVQKLLSHSENISNETIKSMSVSNKEEINEVDFDEYNEEAEVNHEFSHDLVIKAKHFIEKLQIWREKSKHMAIDEFIWYLYTDTGYYGYVGAMPAGVQRQANLRILFQRAKQYEETSYKGLFNFINFINKLKISSGDMGSAKTIGENENVVRIMSIHKSKGLEFPIVFVSGMGKNFNLMDMNKNILFHQELGFGPDFVDPIKRISYPTILKESIKKKIKIETLSEEMRILYVALTRAKEKLIITGSIKNLVKNAVRWSQGLSDSTEKVAEYEILKGKSFLDWIAPAVIKHKDGQPLRDLAEVSERANTIVHHNSEWKVDFWDINSIQLEKKEEIEEILLEERLKSLEQSAPSKYNEEISKRLDYKYKYEEATKIPTVITVTELKRKFNEALIEETTSEEQFKPRLKKKPLFLQETKGLTAAEKGTAMHSVVQRLNLLEVDTFEQIKNQINIMVINEMITQEEADSIRINKVINLFKMDLGKRLVEAAKANNLFREVPFHIEISSTEIDKNLSQELYGDQKIILQGIIDCYFEEDGELILVDYKTDYVENNDTQKMIDRYKIQLEYYARALEKTLNKKVKEKYLYLFSIDNSVEIL